MCIDGQIAYFIITYVFAAQAQSKLQVWPSVYKSMVESEFKSLNQTKCT